MFVNFDKYFLISFKKWFKNVSDFFSHGGLKLVKVLPQDAMDNLIISQLFTIVAKLLDFLLQQFSSIKLFCNLLKFATKIGNLFTKNGNLISSPRKDVFARIKKNPRKNKS